MQRRSFLALAPLAAIAAAFRSPESDPVVVGDTVETTVGFMQDGRWGTATVGGPIYNTTGSTVTLTNSIGDSWTYTL